MLDVFTFKIRVPELQILPFAFATRNKKSKCRLQAPLIGRYTSRPIVYTVKTCHCTSFRQGESQTSNNQTTIQTDAPSNHQRPISGDIWWRMKNIPCLKGTRKNHSFSSRPPVEFLPSLDLPLFLFCLTGQLKGCIACLRSQDPE